MSMPEFPTPDPNLTQEQALTMILSSIALEELALSHIINAEGEKIQYILGQSNCGKHLANVEDVLAVNKSVTNLLEMVMQNQLILKNKMDRVLEYLPRPPQPPCVPEPPYPPSPPCPPKPDCPPPCAPNCCCQLIRSACFCAVPNTYCRDEPLLWTEKNVWGRFGINKGNCAEIQLPRTGTFMVDFYAEFERSKQSNEGLELIISCEDKPPVIKKIFPADCQLQSTVHKKMEIQMPCCCFPCYASVFVRISGGICVRQGQLSFTKA